MEDAAQPTQGANGGLKFFLRLDDGSLIGRADALGVDGGGSTVVRLSFEEAARVGRGGAKEVERLEAILKRLRALQPAPLVLPGAAGAPAPHALVNVLCLSTMALWLLFCLAWVLGQEEARGQARSGQ
jgi:hypothetical protein